MTALRFGEQHMLENLCQVFRISPAITGTDKRAALTVLAALYIMPSIEDHAKRRELGITVLKAAHEAVPPTGRRHASQFQQQVGGIVIMMQELPTFYGNFRHSEDALLRKHRMAKQVVYVLRALGLHNFGGAVNSGVGTYVQSGSVKAAAGMSASRLVGMSDFTDALRKRLGGATGRTAAANAVSAALLVLATGVYASASENIREIEHIADHRFKAGELSEDGYESLFPSADGKGVERYWEY